MEKIGLLFRAGFRFRSGGGRIAPSSTTAALGTRFARALFPMLLGRLLWCGGSGIVLFVMGVIAWLRMCLFLRFFPGELSFRLRMLLGLMIRTLLKALSFLVAWLVLAWLGMLLTLLLRRLKRAFLLGALVEGGGEVFQSTDKMVSEIAFGFMGFFN
jgi:hypothetical protein